MAFKPSQTPNNNLNLSEKICELDQANESNETDFSTFDFNVNKHCFEDKIELDIAKFKCNQTFQN